MRQSTSARALLPLIIAVVAAAGCRDEHFPTENRLGPPIPWITATTRIIGGDSPALEVSAVLGNPNASHILMPTSDVCPLYVRIFPDSSGQAQSSLGPLMACSVSSTAPLLDLAPGDSTRLSRIIPSDSLASYPPGTYGVEVAITIVNGVIGVWAGAIHLPLTPSP